MSGTASIAYASSLQYLNDHTAGPAFASSTGYKYSGQGAASGTLSSEIAGGEITPNVFESVGGDNITPLQPKFTKWYVQYAGTSMVVAYNPKSKYAPQFKAIADGQKPLKDLFPLLENKGLKLGRTHPNVDPQGRDFIYMLELAQKAYHLPADTVTKILGDPPGRPRRRRSTPSHRWTRRCSPVSPAPKNLPGCNSVRRIAAANSLNSGVPSRPSRNKMSGMNTGTSRARPARKSTLICSISGRAANRVAGLDQRRAELAAQHGLDLGRGGARDRLGRLVAGPQPHRLADDADAHALERGGAARGCA